MVEVVSPDNPEHDTVMKRIDYAEARITEYWIVDPQQEQLTVLRLDDDIYVEQGVFGRSDEATSALPQGFGVNVDAVSTGVDRVGKVRNRPVAPSFTS